MSVSAVGLRLVVRTWIGRRVEFVGGLVGYELHITRAEESYDSEEVPILLDEWLGYAASSPLLAERGWVQWTDIGRVPVFAYACGDGIEVSLTFDGAQINVKGVLDDLGALELAKIAEDLQANLIGDDGERYTTAGIVPRGRR